MSKWICAISMSRCHIDQISLFDHFISVAHMCFKLWHFVPCIQNVLILVFVIENKIYITEKGVQYHFHKCLTVHLRLFMQKVLEFTNRNNLICNPYDIGKQIKKWYQPQYLYKRPVLFYKVCKFDSVTQL